MSQKTPTLVNAYLRNSSLTYIMAIVTTIHMPVDKEHMQTLQQKQNTVILVAEHKQRTT